MLGKCSASILITTALRADHHSSLIMDTKHRVRSIYALTQPSRVLLQIILRPKENILTVFYPDSKMEKEDTPHTKGKKV